MKYGFRVVLLLTHIATCRIVSDTKYDLSFYLQKKDKSWIKFEDVGLGLHMCNPDILNKITKPVFCDYFNFLELVSENKLKYSDHYVENDEKVMKLYRKSSRPGIADFMSDLDHGRILNCTFTRRDMKIAIDIVKHDSLVFVVEPLERNMI